MPPTDHRLPQQTRAAHRARHAPRLLPVYLDELHAARTRRREHQAQQADRVALVADLAETLGARLVDAEGGEMHFGSPNDRATGFLRVTTADQGARVSSLRVARDAVLPLARALHALNTVTPEPAPVRVL